MNKKIHVLYDISILGRAHLDVRSRTGIFRVVESIFQELCQEEKVFLLPTSLHEKSDFWDSFASQLYLESSDSELAKSNFLDFYEGKIPFYKIRTGAQKFLITDSQKNRSLTRRAFRYGIASACKMFDLVVGFDSRSISIRPDEIRCKISDIDDSVVYHSPFLAFPKLSLLPEKIPRIITVYDLIPVKFPQFFTNSQIDLVVSMLSNINLEKDWIACISENTKNDLLDFFGGKLNESRVAVTPLAAANKFYPVKDVDKIESILRKYNIPEKSPYILSLCTLEPRKNLSAVVRTFSKLVEQEDAIGLNLVLVGTQGWKNKEIFQEINKNSQLSSRIILTGFVPDGDLSAIYSGALCFVYPSLYEGFGLPPLEAMQCGIPVITSNNSSLPEVVGDAGIMVDANNDDEICQALYKLTGDTFLRQELSKKSIQRASQFSWKKCADETIKLYEKAIANS